VTNPHHRRISAMAAQASDAYDHGMALVDVGVRCPDDFAAILEHWTAILRNPAGEHQLVVALAGLLSRAAMELSGATGVPADVVVERWRAYLAEKSVHVEGQLHDLFGNGRLS
jgi:hypothetical protein